MKMQDIWTKKVGLRWALALLLAVCMLFATECGKGGEEAPAETEATLEAATQTPVGQLVQNAQSTSTPSPSALPTPGQPAQLEVTQTVAYYFPETKNLYAAIEYENTGSGPAYVEEVALQFNTGSGTVDGSFVPMLNTEDYIFPGQKASLAYWRKYDGEGLDTDSAISLENVVITAANRPEDVPDLRLSIQDCSVIQNYPAFATLTGNAINETERNYALSLIYASFYDDAGQLVGVWHFTKNMAIQAESKRTFSVHLEALPIPDLEGRTAEIVARGIGIE